jgi:hypothetical protein
MNIIPVKQGEVPVAKSLFEDTEGVRWLILTSYQHENMNYVTAVEIPDEAGTYCVQTEAIELKEVKK